MKDYFILDGYDLPNFIFGSILISIVFIFISSILEESHKDKQVEESKSISSKPAFITEIKYEGDIIEIYKEDDIIYGVVSND